MVLIVHGNVISTCTARVLVSFFAMGLEPGKDFKLVHTEFSELKTPGWIAHQPFGQMPWMQDTDCGIEVFESRAIVAYVAAKIKSPLAPGPDNLAAFAKYQMGLNNEVAQFDGPACSLAFELYFAAIFGEKKNDAVAAKQQANLTSKLEGYEHILAKQKYIGGDQITLADFSHIAYANVLSNVGAAPTLTDVSLPNLARWWKEITAHPAWIKTREFGHPDHGKAANGKSKNGKAETASA